MAPSMGGWIGPQNASVEAQRRSRWRSSWSGVIEAPAAGREGLVQRGGEHHARMERHAGEVHAAAVLAGDAHAVGVVDVQVQLLVAVEQVGERGDVGEVAVHAVDAVDHVPDLAVGLTQRLDALLELEVIPVAQQLHVAAVGPGQGGAQLHRVVDLLIQDDRVLLLGEHGHGAQVPQGGAAGEEGRAPEERAELLLEGGVRRRGEVGPRGRELAAIALGGADDPRADPVVHLEAQVRAGAEGDERPPTQDDLPAVERLIFDVAEHEPRLAAHGEDVEHGALQLGSFHWRTLLLFAILVTHFSSDQSVLIKQLFNADTGKGCGIWDKRPMLGVVEEFGQVEAAI